MPSNVFLFKPIEPTLLSIKQVSGAILAQMEKEKKTAVRLLNITTENWVAEKPNMDGEIKFAGGDLTLTAGPDDTNYMGRKKWLWLDQGTQVRYAVMSRDWASKTYPGTLATGPGAGYVVNRGYRAGAHPGIEARGWSYLITQMLDEFFYVHIQDAINRGISYSKKYG